MISLLINVVRVVSVFLYKFSVNGGKIVCIN